MPTRFIQLEQRVVELEDLANEVLELAKRATEITTAEDLMALKTKGERWYRGSRELLAQQKFSGLEEFESCYQHVLQAPGIVHGSRATADIDNYIYLRSSSAQIAKGAFPQFLHYFEKARALVKSCVEELESRELPVRTQLSFTVSADEFETAETLIKTSSEEPILRASGVVARVALERHLFTVAESKSIPVQVNPPTKKKPEAQDVITTLVKHSVITPIQESELMSLFKIGNNCAHPKEAVKVEDVKRLLQRGRELAAMIL
jgi:hypothetical protein